MAPPNLKNIQGDIWPRLPKKHESFVFFEILDKDIFKKQLKNFIPAITTAETAYKLRKDIYKKKETGEITNNLIRTLSINLSFSSEGLEKIGKTDLGDEIFKNGMYQDMVTDGLDRGDEWLGEYKGSRGDIHGVFILAATDVGVVGDAMSSVLNNIFVNTGAVRYIFAQAGDVLEHDLEHFGWKDGVSQPQLKDLDRPPKGTEMMPPIPAGYIIVGEEGDTEPHPDWAKGGSFMVFRRLKQLVPEFTQYAVKNILPQASPDGSIKNVKMGIIATLSSRLVGRWPNGIPIDMKPGPDHEMDKALARAEEPPARPDLIDQNNFDFADPDGSTEWQDRCPFASHIRKVRPRADRKDQSGQYDDTHAIIRRGIPYGPETTNAEKAAGVSMQDRGLLFVSYQSNLHNGFRQMQKEWANKTNFPGGKTKNYNNMVPGLDPIIGQWAEDDDESNFTCIPQYEDPRKVHKWKLERLVIAEGGEYFFSPSISGLHHLCEA